MVNLTVFKYPLTFTSRQTVIMRKAAHVLCVQMQHDVPCLWAMVGPSGETEEREFLVVATGEPMAVPLGRYIGTLQQFNGSLIWHVFEALRR